MHRLHAPHNQPSGDESPAEAVATTRRALIGTAAGLGAAALVAPGVVLHTLSAQAETAPITNKSRWGLLIETDKCAEGCRACIEACDHEHGLDRQVPEGSPSKWEQQKAVWIRKVKLQDNQTGRITQLPLMCQHCEHPPCVDVCPTGASFKRADGIVMVDRHLCIGCRYCMMACPYKARSFIHHNTTGQLTAVPRGKGCVESCNLCVHRRDYGQDSTACADACAATGHHAILFGDLKDPESPIRRRMREIQNRQIREDLGLNTGVRYAGI
ncbi:4Fe-4S dicluster domain-containing protein [Caldichromatium japonicum]|uniref:4Fe-4S dicluster domain-containing protein n=1 Tax=Caldichromatium japonicum TaxID=2699430 RepID=A0A6G7VAU6_9GAMM|nr:4Fe-4S dicluster domain-containing protein [Caldichromatium japonicum]QIK37030.1 4Fe-4S dicluster domain-containing protein [Caldichromatium japonicum]